MKCWIWLVIQTYYTNFFKLFYLSNSSIASSVAVKILSPKFGRLGYYYSKAKLVDWFDGMLEYSSDSLDSLKKKKTLNDHVCILCIFF